MRLSTKIFLALFITFLIPSIFLTRYIIAGIIPTQTGITFSFDGYAIAGLVTTAISLIFFNICYFRFIKMLKLSYAIFFLVTPMTLLYSVGIFLLAQVQSGDDAMSVAVASVMNLSRTDNIVLILWVVLFTLSYLIVFFLSITFICRPLSKVELYSRRLSDGSVPTENFKLGGVKQFKDIEHSLNKINYNYRESENMVRKTNLEAQKFIPKQFFRFLGKTSITELELGNNVQKKATTLFCDMKSSTIISGTLSLEENFNFINSYLNVVSPLVRRYDGFVDKYMGDGLLAVFARPQNAMECAIAILRAIEIKNKGQKKLPNIDARISINTGEVVFGIVGEQERKSPTIISDVVNLASKMQEVNTLIGTKIVFSKTTLSEFPDSYEVSYRYVGVLNIEGQVSTPLFECISYYNKNMKERLSRLKNKFENGVRAYCSGEYKKAKEIFEEVLKYVPSDTPSYVYYNKACEKLDTKKE